MIYSANRLKSQLTSLQQHVLQLYFFFKNLTPWVIIGFFLKKIFIWTSSAWTGYGCRQKWGHDAVTEKYAAEEQRAHRFAPMLSNPVFVEISSLPFGLQTKKNDTHTHALLFFRNISKFPFMNIFAIGVYSGSGKVR